MKQKEIFFNDVDENPGIDDQEPSQNFEVEEFNESEYYNG